MIEVAVSTAGLVFNVMLGVLLAVFVLHICYFIGIVTALVIKALIKKDDVKNN